MTIACPKCRKVYSVGDGDDLNDVGQCEGCGTRFTIGAGVKAFGEVSASRNARAPAGSITNTTVSHGIVFSFLDKITKPAWFFIHMFTLLGLLCVVLVVKSVTKMDELPRGPTLLVTIIAFLVSISLFICLVRFLVSAFIKVCRLLRTLPSRIKAAMAAREAAYAHGKYISFKDLTQSYREGIIGTILCGLADILMFQFPYVFHQYWIPNVFLPRWQKWEFLQIVAISLVTWCYFIQVIIFYGSGVTAFVYEMQNDRERPLAALGHAIGAMFLAALLVAFTLFLAKALVEIVSVFLKIEENTDRQH